MTYNEQLSARVNKLFNQYCSDVKIEDVSEILNDGNKLESVRAALKGAFSRAELMWNLLTDWHKGEYKAPWGFIVAVAAALLYLFCPLDVIPDCIIGLGYVDDIAVFGIVGKAFSQEIDDYLAWQNAKNGVKNVG